MLTYVRYNARVTRHSLQSTLLYADTWIWNVTVTSINDYSFPMDSPPTTEEPTILAQLCH